MRCIKSLVTNKHNIKLFDEIYTKDIIDLYFNDFGIDVSHYFENLQKIQLYECLDTGYKFYFPFHLIGEETFYDSLKEQMPIKYNSSYYAEDKWEYNVSSTYIQELDEVYEIGAGTGMFLKKLKNAGINNVSGSELNNNSIKTALTQDVLLENKTIENKAAEKGPLYDVVCSFQVLEHIADVNSFITSCLKILKHEGKLIISVPYNEPYMFANDRLNTLNLPPHHMGLWNELAFKNLCKFFPISVVNIIIEELPSTGYNFERYYQVNKDILYPQKKPFKKLFDLIYLKYLKKFHYKFKGKNIVVIFEKNSLPIPSN